MAEPLPAPEIPVLDFLKQRSPILMVDRVLGVEKGRSIRTLKNISVNDVHFQGHFPEAPIFPGVLTVECFAQTAAILIRMIDGEAPGRESWCRAAARPIPTSAMPRVSHTRKARKVSTCDRHRRSARVDNH